MKRLNHKNLTNMKDNPALYSMVDCEKICVVEAAGNEPGEMFPTQVYWAVATITLVLI